MEEPARVSVPRRVALPPFISMGCPPSSYSPSGMPAQRRESLMRSSLSPNSLWVARMTGGMDVQAVADQLHRGAAVQRRADDPGLPVEEGGHAVEEVGGVAGARAKGRHGGVIAGGGVAQGDGARLGDLPDKGHGPLLLAAPR